MSLNGFFMVQGLVVTALMTIGYILTDALIPDAEWISPIKDIFITVLVFGVVILLISFLGCFGACMKIRWMLITYAVALLVLIVGQIILLSISAANRQETENHVKEVWMGDLKNYTLANNHSMVEIDDLQKKLECCGVESVDDWKDNLELNKTFSVPSSCCKNDTANCGQGYFSNPDNYKIYTDGCYDEARANIMIYLEVAFWFIITIIGVQAVLVVAAFCLAHKGSKKSDN